MNVRSSKHISKLPKETVSQGYTNVSKVQQEDKECQGYQIVQEHGLDPNGEYTDLTLKLNPDQASDATLQREKMINDLLFPPPKNAPKRFNYTDVQLTSINLDDEPEAHDIPRDLDSVVQSKKKRFSKPKVKPKPKNIQNTLEDYREDEISVDHTENLASNGVSCSGKACSWKCCNRAIYAVLLVVCICISLVAVAVAAVAFTRSSGVCKPDALYGVCTISANESNCTVTTDSIEAKVII